MALVLNGNGTITGLAVGGVPDGSITSANLAVNPNRNNIVKTQHFTDNTRTGLSLNSGNVTLWSFTYSKVTASNDIIIMFNLPFSGAGGSGAVRTYGRCTQGSNTDNHYGTWVYAYASNCCPTTGIAHFTGSFGTGNHTISIGWDNGGYSSGRPAVTYCPQQSSGDDGRIGNTVATCTVIEYTPA